MRARADTKRALCKRLFESYRERVGLDLFPLVRLLMPDVRGPISQTRLTVQRDRHRANYGLKENKLAAAYVEALGLDPKANPAAAKMIAWKTPIRTDQVRSMIALNETLTTARAELGGG